MSAGSLRHKIHDRLHSVPLQARLVVIVCILTAIAIVITTSFTAYVMRRDLINRIDDELRSAAVPVTTQALQNGNTNGNGSNVPTSYAVLVVPQGSVVQQVSFPTGVASQPLLPRLLSSDPRVVSGRPFTVGSVSGDDQWRVIAGQVTGSSTVVAVAVNLEPVEHTVRQLLMIAGLVGLIALLAVAGVGWYAIRRAFRPLIEIEDTAAKIAEGDLTQRIPLRGADDEVSSLAHSLNQMLAQIEQSFAVREASEERMRQFVADASHELRTPLAAVRGYAELYRQGAVREPADVAGAMGRIESEATRMSGLVGDLLQLARLDERPEAPFRDVDLLVLAADATSDARALAPNRRIRAIGLQGPLGQTMVHGSDAQLRQVLTNLIGNAIMHTPDGTPIEVAVGHRNNSAGEQCAVIEVRDHGPGIDPATAQRVFERFFRADKARSRASGGSGLGLAIVAAIAAGHEGRVGVVATPGGGATFVVEIPTARSQQTLTAP